MKTASPARRLILAGILILSCLLALQPAAQADTVDDIADVLDELGPANPFKPYGVTGGSLRTAKGFFNCLDQGTDPIVCIDNIQNTQLGQELSKQADIPSWFWDLVDLYVAFKNKDYWGVVWNLGEAAVCIVAHYFTATDVCGLIEDLVNAAKEVYEGAKEVIEFLSALGEGVWEGLKDAGCELGLGGCDDGPPPPPPHEVAYGAFFAPALVSGEALKAKEAVGPEKFDHLLNALIGKARGGPCGLQCANMAADKFKQKVDEQWTGDIADRVLKEVAQQRNAYNTPQTIAAAVKANCDDPYPGAPGNTVPFRCQSYFKTTLGYDHLDRWIISHPGKAAQMAVKSNPQWCQETFWDGNKALFAAAYQDYIKGRCPESGSKLLCSKLADFQTCQTVMKAFGQEAACDYTLDSALQGKCPATAIQGAGVMRLCATPDDYQDCRSTLSWFKQEQLCTFTPAAAKLAADFIAAEFKAKGSTLPCLIKSGTLPGQAADFVCKRPRQEQHCQAINKAKFGTLLKPLVNCAPYDDPVYDLLRNNVNQVVAQLNGAYGDWLMTADPYEPLFVYSYKKQIVPAGLPADLKKALPGIVLVDAAPKFPFDGLSAPLAGLVTKLDSKWFKPELTGVDKKQQLKDILEGGGNPLDLVIGQKGLDKGGEKIKDFAGSNELVGGKTGNLKPGGGDFKTAVDLKSAETGLAKTMGKAGGAPALDALGAAQANPLSGPATAKSGGSQSLAGLAKAPAAVGQVPQAAKTPAGASQSTPMSLQFPDLTAADTVTVSGKTQQQTTKWNTAVTLDAKDALNVSNGTCTFTVRVALRNPGSGASGSFKSAWTSTATGQTVERAWAGIAPGATSSPESDAISLKPGQNLLTLDIDKTGLVKESNETNNQFRLPLNLNGICGEQSRPVVPIRR